MVTRHRQQPAAVLTVHQGPRPGQRFSLTKPTVVIGREAGNDVVINHPQVSRRHASLTWDGRRFIIQDLGSINGTFVNGVRLTAPHALQPGDLIGLGPTVLLTFQATLPVYAAPPAKRRGRGRVNLPLLVTLLGLICLASTTAGVAVWLYGDRRRQVINNRPLVLIHAPLNRERIPVGQSILVSATARATGGVERVELWADGALVFAQEAPATETPPSLGLSAPWEPATPGRHVLVVRATSADGVDGQSSVSVRVEEAAPAEHVVEEGETLESIAAEHGLSVDELLASNPALASEGLAPGDTVHVPGRGVGPGPVGGPSGGGMPPPPADEPAPVPDDAAPGSLPDVLEFVGFERLIPADAAAAEPVGVRVEALALVTGATYESLHCYVGIGAADPRWYPDQDHDQSTQESFASLGGGAWDVAAHLGGDHAATIMWPGNEPVPFTVTCVGVGETDAVEVGRLNLNVRPEAWDGVIRRAVSEGGVGSFALDYRFSLGRPFGGTTKIPDPDMASPTNLRIVGFELRWDYEPHEEQEEPIDGFRIYLNNTRQFIVPARSSGISAPPGWTVLPAYRRSSLPPEWFNPPCGFEYSFTVTAYRDNPDDPADPYESYHSDPLVISGDDPEECELNVWVDFEHLTIHHGFRPDESRTDSISGRFGVNDRSRRFDDRTVEPGRTYPVTWLLWGSASWDYEQQFELPLTPAGIHLQFEVYYHNGDGDSLLCAGDRRLFAEEVFASGGGYVRGTFSSDRPDARCEAGYLIRPITEGLRGVPGAYLPHLPNLKVTDIVVDEDSGRVGIEVLNDGGATWAAHDLTIRLERRSGDLEHSFRLRDLVLFPGDSTTTWTIVAERPTDICVILDPDNEVVEIRDTQDSYLTPEMQPYCNPLPDLRIYGVHYDPSEERLLIAVENVGEAGTVVGDLQAQIHLPDGGYLRPLHPFPWSDMALGPWGSGPPYVLEWPMSEEQFASLRRTGYTVTIDPDDRLTESNETNNAYTVGGSTRIRLRNTGLRVLFYPIWHIRWLDNMFFFMARVFAVNEQITYDRWITDFGAYCVVYASSIGTGEIERAIGPIGPYSCEPLGPPTERYEVETDVDWPDDHTVEFDVGGDEGVAVLVTGDLDAESGLGSHYHYYLGSEWIYYNRDVVTAAPICGSGEWESEEVWVYPPDLTGPWITSFGICRLEE